MSRLHERSLTVGEVMHQGVVTCASETTLREVAALLARHRIHAVIVLASDEAVRGVITDRDVVFAHATGTLDGTTAGDAATEPTITVRPTLDLMVASELMTRHATPHVVVTEGTDRRPVGVLSSLDVARAVASGPDARGSPGEDSS
jgi:CBS domain-containing protein